MGATTDEFAAVLVELTDSASDFGEALVLVKEGLTAASFGLGTSGSASVVYDPASGGYVAAAPVEGSGTGSAAASVETAFRGVMLGVVKQPRATDEAVQSGAASVICPPIVGADNVPLQPVIGDHVRAARGTFQIVAVSPLHVQGGTSGWRLVLGA